MLAHVTAMLFAMKHMLKTFNILHSFQKENRIFCKVCQRPANVVLQG